MNNLSKTIKFDKITGQFIRPTLLLEQSNGKRLGKINYDNLSISFGANKIDEISFDVHKYINGQKNKLWDELQGLKIINYKDYGLFLADFTINESNESIKTCIAQSLEVELCHRTLRDLHVNDEEAITVIDTNETFQPTVFYDENDPKHSLLHRILSEKAPHWNIGTVPELLNVNETIYQSNQIQRTFTVDSESIYDFLTGEVSQEFNVAFLFDTYNRQINCYNAEECIYNKNTLEVAYGGYELDGQYYAYDENGNLIQLPQADYSILDCVGKDTHILVTTNKLSQSFQLDENSDAVKNTFYITGGDDVITNFVAQANITGKNYITIFSKMQYDDMSEELVQLTKQYNQLLESKETTFNAPGGVYLQNSSYEYNGNTAKNKTTGELTTDFRLDSQNNVYILDSCAYINNGKAYSRDDVLLTSGYIVDDNEGLFTKYCHLSDRYYYLTNSKFPLLTLADTTATEQYEKLSQHFRNSANQVLVYNSCDITSFQSVQNTIETMLKVVCDSRYNVKILSSSDNTSTTGYNNPSLSNSIDDTTTTATWTATIRLTRETSSTDTHEGQLSVFVQKIKLDDIDTNNAYCKQRMDIAIAKMSIADLDFTNYQTEEQLLLFFSQYNLTTLKSYKDAFSSCLSTLEDVYSNSMAADIKDSPSSSYTELHNQYFLRQNACEKVYTAREEQVSQIQSQINACLSSIEKLRQELDMESYFKNPQNGGSEELWLEYNMYIREDEYNNNNYISDGLSDAELLSKAKELIEAAKKELKRACVAQKTISGSLNNIFTQKELEQLYDDFSLYNYVRCRVDDHYYKLRLLEVELHESNLTEIQCTFAENVEDVTGAVENIKSILEQASSMSSSYSSTVKQSKQGASALNNFTVWKKEGLDSAEYVIKNSVNEEIIIDNNGINCKSMNDIGFYGDHQCRLTGNGLHMTDNAWKEVRSAIGLIKFNNIWQYGVIADCIIGNFIAGEKAYIGNDKDTVEITGEGIKISNGYIQSANYEDGKSGSMLDLTNGTFSFAGGKLRYDNEILAIEGTIETTSGLIGGWIITPSSIKKTDNNGSYMSLDSSGKSLVSYNNITKMKTLFSNSKILFQNESTLYLSMYVTNWNNRAENGLNFYSNEENKYVCFGYDKDTSVSGYEPTLVLNYGLNPGGDTQDVLIYGTSKFSNMVYFDNKCYFNNGSYINALSGGGVYCSSNLEVAGNLNVIGTGVIKQLNDGGHSISMGWVDESEDLQVLVDKTYINLARKKHNLNTHTFTETEYGNFKTGLPNDNNIASVKWVQGKLDSDERVKTDFQELPTNIDNIFDSLKPQQYKFNHILEKEGYYFGDTAQHIEKIFEDYGLDIDDYNIVQKREVNEFNGELNFIDPEHDKYHYINQDNIVWLCVDQIQKLKKQNSLLQSENNNLKSKLETIEQSIRHINTIIK